MYLLDDLTGAVAQGADLRFGRESNDRSMTVARRTFRLCATGRNTHLDPFTIAIPAGLGIVDGYFQAPLPAACGTRPDFFIERQFRFPTWLLNLG